MPVETEQTRLLPLHRVAAAERLVLVVQAETHQARQEAQEQAIIQTLGQVEMAAHLQASEQPEQRMEQAQVELTPQPQQIAPVRLEELDMFAS
jgi:hypothetical protein